MDPTPDDGLNTDGLDLTGVVRMIRVTVPAELGDVVSDRFWQVGVRGVSEIDLADGRVEITSSVGNDQDAIDRTVATFDSDWEWVIDEVSGGPADTWKEFATPVWYRPGMVIVPAWLDTGDDEVDEADVVTRVEPGSAFGLGDHPTTKGSMALLAAALERLEPAGASVLDVGCGTGVLAVLAAQLGVGTVRAIDIAHAAVSATRTNAELNGVAGRVEVDTTAVDLVVGTFDVVVANILAPVLVSMAPHLVRLTSPRGCLVISGLLESRHDHVLRALAPLQPVDSLVEDGWITIELRHPGGRVPGTNPRSV